jgi:hypothetical protein
MYYRMCSEEALIIMTLLLECNKFTIIFVCVVHWGDEDAIAHDENIVAHLTTCLNEECIDVSVGCSCIIRLCWVVI